MSLLLLNALSYNTAGCQKEPQEAYSWRQGKQGSYFSPCKEERVERKVGKGKKKENPYEYKLWPPPTFPIKNLFHILHWFISFFENLDLNLHPNFPDAFWIVTECLTHKSVIQELNFLFLELFKLTRLGSIPLTWRSCSSIHCVLLTKDVEPSNCFTFVIDAWAGFLFVTKHIKEKACNWNRLNVSGTWRLVHFNSSWFAGVFSIMSHKANTSLILKGHSRTHALFWITYWKPRSRMMVRYPTSIILLKIRYILGIISLSWQYPGKKRTKTKVLHLLFYNHLTVLFSPHCLAEVSHTQPQLISSWNSRKENTHIQKKVCV